MRIGDLFAQLGTILATFMFLKPILEKYFPKNPIEKHFQKLFTFLSPYIQITFNEFTGERLMRSEAYSAVQTYLTSNSSAQARRLKAEIVKNSKQGLSLSMDDNEEVADEFDGVKVWWASAMDHDKKWDIVNDLLAFTRGEDFYARIGRAWKRGYLLYGPPGTGKSTMIAAMANLLNYDLYDLELTAVKDNTELKKLLIATSSKAIIVIEDIDCSVDLTGQRSKKMEKSEQEENDVMHKMAKQESDQSKNSKITLSGLLNFIDGLWSACGGERIIVFTTNYVEKLDPALIRRGRMDKHIELSYCSFEGFKVLAKNYLGLEWHDLFPRIESLLGEIKITPADVAENLMPKGVEGDAEICLKNLVLAMEAEQKSSKKNVAEVGKGLPSMEFVVDCNGH
ncbi:hypothetical protein DH2020_038990 [Rehmannia glutinosa]|uniref:AAA+ ATPase domain-containing protein n=1 Tax=Rehmannia glutinosa TaxID=99300 RepID=A0ABR0UX24_REHGL